MTAGEIIEEIKRLPKDEQTTVLDFFQQAADNCRLTPEELGELAKRMANTQDSAEADRLRDKIVRGFYGGDPHA